METTNQIIEDSTLRAIEELWGYQLPKDYRNFILENNGGTPKKKMFHFKAIDDGSCIDEFFGFVKGINQNILLKQRHSGERVPENTLPIARDVYGNLIVLSVKGLDRGKIYFWDHEMEAAEGEEPDYSNLTLIADSFDEFVNSLHEVKDQ